MFGSSHNTCSIYVKKYAGTYQNLSHPYHDQSSTTTKTIRILTALSYEKTVRISFYAQPKITLYRAKLIKIIMADHLYQSKAGVLINALILLYTNNISGQALSLLEGT